MRGKPKRGFRLTKKRIAAGWTAQGHQPVATTPVVEEVSNETDTEIFSRLQERFEIIKQLTETCVKGEARALIVSGPAGLGKSYTVERALADWDPNAINHTIIKGYVRATGLYKTLYQYRNPGQVIVFDDADYIFFDDIALNLLKAVCDTTEQRVVSWLSEGVLVDEETSDVIPRHFEFDGTIIFITNYDFDHMIEKGHKLAPHLQALVSRSHYIDTSMKTRRDYLIRIRQVVEQGLLKHLSKTERDDVVSYIESNHTSLRELSLRMALKIGAIRKTASNWERVAHVTCCK